MKMTKKITAIVVAAASALSLAVSASAATGTTINKGTTSFGVDATALMAIPPVTITWPTAAGVILNPYKMKVDIPTASITATTKVAGSTKNTAVDYSILSPELKFVNTGLADVAITVSSFSAEAKTVKAADGTVLDTPTASTIKFATTAIKHETVKESTGAVTAGDVTNSVLLFLEVATPTVDDTTGKITGYTYTNSYSSTNKQQLIAGTTAAPKNAVKFFNVPAKGAVNGEAHVMVCGDMSYNPTVPWSQIALTDEISVSMVFDVVLKTPQEIIP